MCPEKKGNTEFLWDPEGGLQHGHLSQGQMSRAALAMVCGKEGAFTKNLNCRARSHDSLQKPLLDACTRISPQKLRDSKMKLEFSSKFKGFSYKRSPIKSGMFQAPLNDHRPGPSACESCCPPAVPSSCCILKTLGRENSLK